METLVDDITIRRCGSADLAKIQHLNREIFGEDRLINSMRHDYLLMLVAERHGIPLGFKIGYRDLPGSFYSAKGGVHPQWRRQGLARRMLRHMMAIARADGFTWFRYHTFPARWPGMLSLGLSEGFRIAATEWNPTYGDYQVLLEFDLQRLSDNS